MISLSLFFLMSLYWCIHTLQCRENPLPPFFFFFFFFFVLIVCRCHLSDVNSYVSSTFLSSSPFVWVPPLSILWMVLSILQRELPLCLFLLMRVILQSLLLRSFHFDLKYSFFKIFSSYLHLFNGVCFQYF